MMRRPRSSLFLVFFVFAFFAQSAKAYLELNAFYTSEGLTTGTSATSSRTFIEGSVGFAIDNKGRYQVGWAYSMFSTSDATTTTETYSSSQMGPRFIFFFDKAKNWSLGLGYYLVTSATYADGSGSNETWKGTALKADFGYNTPVGETSWVGIRMNYSGANFSEKLVGSTDYSTVSYAKTLIYPSIYTIWLF